MIVPMKKTTILVQSKDSESCVSKLRSLGILHIEYSKPPAGQDITLLKEQIDQFSQAMRIISDPAYLKSAGTEKSQAIDLKFVSKHLIDLNKRLQQLEDYSRTLNAQLAQWQRWGDFDPLEIERLREKNIYLRLYQVPVKELINMPMDLAVEEIYRSAGFVYCAVISREKKDLPFKELSLPKMGPEKIRARIYEDQRIKELIVDDICRYAAHLGDLATMKIELEKRLQFQEVLQGMGREDSIAYLTGYIPLDQSENLAKAALQEKWGLLIQDPSEDDAPPVLLRNPRWARLIDPVLKLLGIVPGYRELDVEPVFLIFFSIFFGILIGDAGYGLVYLLLTFLFRKKQGNDKRNTNIFILFYVLNTSAIIWGLLTGTFFGQAWLAGSWIKPIVPNLNNPGFMQRFCFFIGALHLTIAHAWRAMVKFPALTFLADLGWIAVLWISFFLAGTLILGTAFPAYGQWLALGGVILILFFSEPRKNLLKRLGAGFTSVTFGLSFMSAFTDVVSYVRLFAVGMAAVAIADTTNIMAAGLGASAIGISAGILIRIVGHALNIVLGPIAILVHGVRLNVLEFGLNHTSITWSGVPYKPLTE